jgi:hypothetical protein
MQLGGITLSNLEKMPIWCVLSAAAVFALSGFSNGGSESSSSGGTTTTNSGPSVPQATHWPAAVPSGYSIGAKLGFRRAK